MLGAGGTGCRWRRGRGEKAAGLAGCGKSQGRRDLGGTGLKWVIESLFEGLGRFVGHFSGLAPTKQARQILRLQRAGANKDMPVRRENGTGLKTRQYKYALLGRPKRVLCTCGKSD